MKQALETLEFIGDAAGREAITSLRQAIEQVEKQEPVAWLSRRYVDNFPASGYETAQPTDHGAFPVYTTPPDREWVGLTDMEWETLFELYGNYPDILIYETEKKLKKKNT